MTQHKPPSEFEDLLAAKSKNKSIVHKRKHIRLFYIFLGTISLLLGIIGIVLPGLPTTPFFLLSGFLYARGSQRIYDALLSHKFFGKKIREYKKNKGIAKSVKLKILMLMAVMLTISTVLMIDNFSLKIVVWGAGLIGAFVVWFIVPTSMEQKK